MNGNRSLLLTAASIGVATGLSVLAGAVVVAGFLAMLRGVHASTVVNSHVLVGLAGAVAIAMAGGFVYGHHRQVRLNLAILLQDAVNTSLLLRAFLPRCRTSFDVSRWSYIDFTLTLPDDSTVTVRRPFGRPGTDLGELIDSALEEFAKRGVAAAAPAPSALNPAHHPV